MLIFVEIPEPIIITLVVVVILFVSALLFMCTGFIVVSKGRVGVLERMGNYIGTYKSGLYYFTPLLYRRVGYYKTGEIVQRFKIDKDNYLVRYKIENFKTFHYVGVHDVVNPIKTALKFHQEDLSKDLIERFNNIGAKFISLEKIKKQR